MNRFEILIQQCDADIRAGRPNEAVKKLAHLGGAKVPREWRLPLAKICRRAGLLAMGLRLLVKLVNPSRPVHHEKGATSAELAEYAVLLLRSGAVHEALQRLKAIDAREVPDAWLFRGYAHFALWEYAQAVPFLEKYVEADLSPHAVLLGRTNLAFALAECRDHERALTLAARNVTFAAEQKAFNLEAFNHAICAQVHLQEGRLAEARAVLKMARSRSPGSQTHDQFYPAKLELIIDGLESRTTKPFERLRELAIARHDWFAAREADLFSLKVDFRMQKFLHLFFGSPLAGFRELITRELGRRAERDVYVLGPKQAPRFDLMDGTLDGQKIDNPGGKSHQMLEVLLRDFYQPLLVAELHASLFPEEHFDILSSPDRVRQILHRTRSWLRELDAPVTINEKHGFYSLVIEGAFSFRIPLERQALDQFSLQIKALKRAFRDRASFSRRELCERLDLSATSAHRLLKSAIETGQIERLGPAKRPTGYRVLEPEQASRANAA